MSGYRKGAEIMDLSGYRSYINYLLGIWLVVINIAGFIICAVDKRRAIKNKWRIPEKSIFMAALLGGSPGTYISLLLFHHKTKHLRFMAGIPLIFAVEAGLLLFIALKI